MPRGGERGASWRGGILVVWLLELEFGKDRCRCAR
jgi:hypothetical protein